MTTDKQNTSIGNVVVSWNIPELNHHQRNRKWYIIAISIAIAMMVFAFMTNNFLFAVIILLASLVIVLTDGQTPHQISFSITDEGIVVGRKFYDYDDIKDFSIVYKPRLNIKNIYFEFNSLTQPRITIPLDDMNPLQIRQDLLKYLTEDLERTDEPLSEVLAKFFKI